jgi:hypothetical protein
LLQLERRTDVRYLTLAAVSACALLAPPAARAETLSVQLTGKKTGDEHYAFAVKAEQVEGEGAGKVLQFSVTVKPKGPARAGRQNEVTPPRYSGTLAIFDGEQPVASCAVQPRERGGAVSYSFRAAARFTERSTFTVGITLGDFDSLAYWFYLAEFAAPAPDGKQPKPGRGGEPEENPADAERLALLKP